MSEQGEGDSVSFEFTFRPVGGSQVTLRQVALGYQPLVLIEPEEIDGNVIFKVDSTFLDRQELADILGLVVEALRQASDDDLEYEDDEGEAP
jgi:hypothetical protein